MGPGNMAPIRIDPHTSGPVLAVSPFTCVGPGRPDPGRLLVLPGRRDAAELGGPWPAVPTVVPGRPGGEWKWPSSRRWPCSPYISFPMQVVQKLLLVVVAATFAGLWAPRWPWRWRRPASETLAGCSASRVRARAGLTHPVATFFLLVRRSARLLPHTGIGRLHAPRVAAEPGQPGIPGRRPAVLVGHDVRPGSPRPDEPGRASSSSLAAASLLQSVLGVALVTRSHAGRADLHPTPAPTPAGPPVGRASVVDDRRRPWSRCTRNGVDQASSSTPRRPPQSRRTPTAASLGCRNRVNRRLSIRAALRRGRDPRRASSASPRRPSPTPSSWALRRPAGPSSPRLPPTSC